MKKVGLCVRYDCDNFGSMLQILATQKAIEKMGWRYEIIRYNKKTPLFMLKNVFRVFNPYFMRGKLMAFSKKRKMKAFPDIEKRNSTRLKLIREYRQKYIGPYSDEYKGFSNLVKGAYKYDAVMVGSDQLWTPAGIKSKFYNLLFVPDSIKKISFATSFGVSKVPSRQIKETAKYLDRIDYISVRELKGYEIVNELTGKEAVIALDPTLLFNAEEWEEIFSNKNKEEEPYIFAYFLGGNPEHRRAVEKLKAETGFKVITCPNMDEFVKGDLTFGDEQRYETDPVDFLNLIRNAEYICTDSFHGSVFSVLNRKKFMTFNRYSDDEIFSKNSRIESFCTLLGLENRRYCGNMENMKIKMDSNIDYDDVDKRIEKLRKETYDFLDKALNG